MNIPWHREPPLQIRIQKIISTCIFIAFLAIIAINVYGFISDNPKILLMSILYFYPSIFAIYLIYFQIKRYIEKGRAKLLSETIERAAYFLRKLSPDIHKFDRTLSADLGEISKGPVSLYLFTTLIFLDFLRTLILTEQRNIDNENRKNRKKRSCIPIEFPYAELYINFRKLEFPIKGLDTVTTFDIFGNLLLIIIRTRKLYQTEVSQDFSEDNFIEKCESISDLLKIRLFNDADQECKDLLNSIRLQKLPDLLSSSIIGWQALIGYWIWIRFSYIKNMTQNETTLWLGPSKMLANQIDAILYFYTREGYRDLSDVILSSFDSRIRVPRIMYVSTATSRH